MYLNETLKNVETKKFTYVFFFINFFLIHVVSGFSADSVLVKAKNNEADVKSIYEVQFSISQAIPSEAEMIVTFPEYFDLSEVLLAGSTTINGGFDLKVEAPKVIITRSGLGRIIEPNEKVDIKFANVRNPSKPADNYKIKVEIKNDLQGTIIEKEDTIKINSQTTK